METVFSMWFMLKYYKQGQLSSEVESCKQFSWVKWSSWGELSVVSWKSTCEENAKGLVWNDCQPGTQLAELSIEKSFEWAAVTRVPECGKVKNFHCVKSVARKWLVKTVTDWGH
jgi:hypothetical protein